MLKVMNDSNEAAPIPTTIASHHFLHPSGESVGPDTLTLASEDEDFTRLANARLELYKQLILPAA